MAWSRRARRAAEQASARGSRGSVPGLGPWVLCFSDPGGVEMCVIDSVSSWSIGCCVRLIKTQCDMQSKQNKHDKHNESMGRNSSRGRPPPGDAARRCSTTGPLSVGDAADVSDFCAFGREHLAPKGTHGVRGAQTKAPTQMQAPVQWRAQMRVCISSRSGPHWGRGPSRQHAGGVRECGLPAGGRNSPPGFARRR